MRKGFTIIELLVTLIIMLLVVGAAYLSFVRIIKGFKWEGKKIETQIEAAVGTEILRLDIEHAGYGIGEDQPDLPIQVEYVSTTGDPLYPSKLQLTIRSVLNNTNTGTIGWVLVDCSGGSVNRIAGDSLDPSTSVVYLGAGNRNFVANGDLSTCPGTGYYVAAPYDSSVTSGCSVQFCNSISYRLSNSQDLETCHPNTRNFLRAVGSGNGDPVLNCVADWRVSFDIDTNSDGNLDITNASFESMDLDENGSVSAQEIRKSLKKVNIYILVQEGRRDNEFTFRGAVSCTSSPSGYCVVVNTASGPIELSLPTDYQNYRWKVVRLSVVPMNL